MTRTHSSARAAAFATALAATVALSLGGCGLPAIFSGGNQNTEPTAAPEPTSGGSGSSSANNPDYSTGDMPPVGVAPVLETDPQLMIMTDELFSRVNTVQGLTWSTSTPDGTWDVGKGFPVEFPVGLPIYPDRWIQDSPLIVESDGVLMLSYTFWGGYAEMEAIAANLESQGYEVASQILDNRRTYIADSDEFKVVLTGAEGVTDIQDPSQVYDPQYDYLVKFYDVPYREG